MATHTPGSESKDEFSMLVDSGASAHFVDSNLLPDLHEFLVNRRELQPRMVIQTAGLHSIYGVATGQLPCIAVDTDGIEREITVRVTLVPGLGRHLFSPKAAQQHGIYTTPCLQQATTLTVAISKLACGTQSYLTMLIYA